MDDITIHVLSFWMISLSLNFTSAFGAWFAIALYLPYPSVWRDILLSFSFFKAKLQDRVCFQVRRKYCSTSEETDQKGRQRETWLKQCKLVKHFLGLELQTRALANIRHSFVNAVKFILTHYSLWSLHVMLWQAVGEEMLEANLIKPTGRKCTLLFILIDSITKICANTRTVKKINVKKKKNTRSPAERNYVWMQRAIWKVLRSDSVEYNWR